jgi:thioredoxin-related protein
MKKNIFSALTIIAAGLLAFTVIDELPIGADMPKADVKMKDISGKEISLKEAVKKNGLLVMFSCNTCPYVIKNQERTNEAGTYALAKNIGFILVNSNEAQRSDEDSYTAMQAYAKKQGYKWHYVVDEKSILADAFGAKKTPECYLFNNEGKLVYHGAIDDNPSDKTAVNRKHLKEAMDQLLKGEDISVKTSRSVGCSIKRL